MSSKEQQSTSGKNLGTKLAKRVKPKVNIGDSTVRNASRTTTATNHKEVKPIDTGQKEEEPIESTKQGDKMVMEAVVKTEEVKLQRQCGDQSLSESTQNSEEKQEIGARKLSKRLKVGPKLSMSRPQSSTKSNNDESVSEKTHLESQSKDVNTPQSNSNINIKADQNVENDSSNKTEVKSDSGITTTTEKSSSRLQKRRKVMPNLRMPPQQKKTKSDIEVESNQNVNVDDKNLKTDNNFDATSGGEELKAADNGGNKLLDVETPGSSGKKERRVHFESSASGSKTASKEPLSNDCLLYTSPSPRDS